MTTAKKNTTAKKTTAKKTTARKATVKATPKKKAVAKKVTAKKVTVKATPKKKASTDNRVFLSSGQKVYLVEFFTQAKKEGINCKDAIARLREIVADFKAHRDSNLVAYYYASGARLVVKGDKVVDTSK